MNSKIGTSKTKGGTLEDCFLWPFLWSKNDSEWLHSPTFDSHGHFFRNIWVYIFVAIFMYILHNRMLTACLLWSQPLRYCQFSALVWCLNSPPSWQNIAPQNGFHIFPRWKKTKNSLAANDDGLEDVSPFKHGYLWVSMYFKLFGGNLFYFAILRDNELIHS